MKILNYILVFVLSLLGFALTYIVYLKLKPSESVRTPITISSQEEPYKTVKTGSKLQTVERINMVLLGIDRRSKDEGYRTDIMVVVSIDKAKNKALLVSLPRDLWWNGGRLNATYSSEGWSGLQTALETITGIKPEKYILTDFVDFEWIVDSMGGVPVTVETTFTDSQYPVDETFEYQTVTFTQGEEKLTGKRALIFSRSRKGDNDNGDWGRMKRQHLILKGMLQAVKQPESIFKNMELAKALDMVTKGRMDTNIALSDATYLWDLHKDWDKYQITSKYMDYDYLFTPPMAEYGGAWVLAPIGGSYDVFKKDLKKVFDDSSATIENKP
jgi:LCP family protein required for cell wall assembly